MPQPDVTIWVQGFTDQRAGKPLTANRYSQADPCHWRWRMGWLAARDVKGDATVRGDFNASAAALASEASTAAMASDADRLAARMIRAPRRRKPRPIRRHLAAAGALALALAPLPALAVSVVILSAPHDHPYARPFLAALGLAS